LPFTAVYLHPHTDGALGFAEGDKSDSTGDNRWRNFSHLSQVGVLVPLEMLKKTRRFYYYMYVAFSSHNSVDTVLDCVIIVNRVCWV